MAQHSPTRHVHTHTREGTTNPLHTNATKHRRDLARLCVCRSGPKQPPNALSPCKLVCLCYTHLCGCASEKGRVRITRPPCNIGQAASYDTTIARHDRRTIRDRTTIQCCVTKGCCCSLLCCTRSPNRGPIVCPGGFR